MVVRQLSILLCLSILVCACKAQQHDDASLKACLSVLQSKLSDNFHYEVNADQSMILATSSVNAAGLSRLLVMHVATRAVVIDQQFRPGSAKWLNKNEIELISLPGTLRENETITKTILKPPIKQ